MICFQKTYCNEHLYKPGERLMPGHKPNKYFSETGLPEAGASRMPTVPGDDARSTAQIRADIEEMGAAPIKGGSRKDLFYQWVALKKEKEEPQSPGPAEAAEPIEAAGISLDQLTRQEMIDYGQQHFGIALNPRAKKEELLEQLLDLQRRGE